MAELLQLLHTQKNTMYDDARGLYTSSINMYPRVVRNACPLAPLLVSKDIFDAYSIVYNLHDYLNKDLYRMWITDNSGAWVVCVAMELPKEDFMWYTDTGTTTDQRTPSPEVISLFLSLFCITMTPCSLSFFTFLYISSHTIPLSRPFICYRVIETKQWT